MTDKAQATVLVVEDDEGMRELLNDELRESGYSVVTVPNLEMALDVLRLGEPDLIVADQRLPDGLGISLLKFSQKLPVPPAFVILTAFGSISDAVSALKQGADDFLTKPIDLEHLRVRLKRLQEVQRLKRMLLPGAQRPELFGVTGKSVAVRRLMDELRVVAQATAPVLIVGESGVGKERVARAVHELGPTASGPFVAVNCAALSESLIESELFGHVQGSFTGAGRDRRGLFEEARNGSILLDEITEIPASTQAKLLRVLQEGSARPVGSNQERSMNARVIATTNRDPQKAVEDGAFRQDLYYRLEAFTLSVPPLRERREDVSLLVATFLKRACAETGKELDGVSSEALDALQEYDFPGNVRELENMIERAVAFCQTKEIAARDLPGRVLESYEHHTNANKMLAHFINADDLPTMEGLKRSYVRYAIERMGGNKRRAAQVLGIGRKTLYRYLEPNSETSPEGIDSED